MTYTPINWQTGDTITAEKMNKMDNGWSAGGLTQLFSETVTTVYDSEAGMSMGVLSYSDVLDAEVIVFDFDGTTYECPRIDMYGTYLYGGFGESEPDFSEIPFVIQCEPADDVYRSAIVTESPGEHEVTASAETDRIEVSQDFADAVSAVAPLPFRCIAEETTYSEMAAARSAGRLLYFYHFNLCHIVTDFNYNGEAAMHAVSAVPEETEYASYGFDGSGVFIIYEL